MTWLLAPEVEVVFFLVAQVYLKLFSFFHINLISTLCEINQSLQIYHLYLKYLKTNLLSFALGGGGLIKKGFSFFFVSIKSIYSVVQESRMNIICYCYYLNMFFKVHRLKFESLNLCWWYLEVRALWSEHIRLSSHDKTALLFVWLEPPAHTCLI